GGPGEHVSGLGAEGGVAASAAAKCAGKPAAAALLDQDDQDQQQADQDEQDDAGVEEKRHKCLSCELPVASCGPAAEGGSHLAIGSYWLFAGIDDGQEALGLEGRATDQTAIDVRLAHQAPGVFG